MISGEQGEGLIYEIITNNQTSGYIKEIIETDLNEATLSSPYKDIDPLGARDPNYNVKAYDTEESANAWAKGDMDVDIVMDDIHPKPSFLCCSSF